MNKIEKILAILQSELDSYTTMADQSGHLALQYKAKNDFETALGYFREEGQYRTKADTIRSVMKKILKIQKEDN